MYPILDQSSNVLDYVNQLEQHRYEAERKATYLQEQVTRLQEENKKLERRYYAFKEYLTQLIDQGAVTVSYDAAFTPEGGMSGRFTTVQQ